MRKITVEQREEGQQLLKLLGRYLQDAPVSFFYKMFRKKNITLNGKKAEGKEKVMAGDEVCFFLSDETIASFGGKLLLEDNAAVRREVHIVRPLPFDIIYEDEDILIVNKPVGMLTQKAAAEDVSLNEHIIRYLLESGKMAERELARFKPGICNRLDRNTSGIVTAGKTLAGAQFLSQAFRERSVHKYYECIVTGEVKEAKKLTGFIKKDEKENKVTVQKEPAGSGAGYDRIQTAYRPVSSRNGYSLLEVELITGKTHQIRAQLAAQGYPLLGDAKYAGPANQAGAARCFHLRHQLLCAKRLVFEKNPDRFSYLDYKDFTAETPQEFQRIRERLGL